MLTRPTVKELVLKAEDARKNITAIDSQIESDYQALRNEIRREDPRKRTPHLHEKFDEVESRRSGLPLFTAFKNCREALQLFEWQMSQAALQDLKLDSRISLPRQTEQNIWLVKSLAETREALSHTNFLLTLLAFEVSPRVYRRVKVICEERSEHTMERLDYCLTFLRDVMEYCQE